MGHQQRENKHISLSQISDMEDFHHSGIWITTDI